MRRVALVYVVVSILMLALVPCTFADIPKIIGYQGRVTDNSGTPVPDGIYDMQFSIWPSASGGTFPLWMSGTHNVEVTDGTFNVLLGTVGATPLDLEFAQDLWLEVTIEGETQTPRQRFGSVGYAYMASGLVAGNEVIGSVETGTRAAVKGTNTATVPLTYGLYGETSSPTGVGCYGSAPTTTGASAYGVYGYTASGGGAGVKGYSSASTGQTCGGYFVTVSEMGKAVYACADALTGYTYGVYGRSESTDGTGVYGRASATAGCTFGVYGLSESPDGRGVYARASATTGVTYGVYGRSESPDGSGVCGQASAHTGYSRGVYGQCNSTSGAGVYGLATSTEGFNQGVCGESGSTDGTGVYGYASATTGYGYGGYLASAADYGGGASCWGRRYGVRATASGAPSQYGDGVHGKSHAPLGKGVYGEGSCISGINYGIYGEVSSPMGYAGYFHGDVHVVGSLTKGSGSFLIDHPLDPENKLLRHSFVESPENLLIYRGRAELDADGEAMVPLPDYFGALTREDEATVNLTPIGRRFLTAYEFSEDLSGFKIHGDPGGHVAWTVYADRDDPVIHQLGRPVEEEKSPDSKYCNRGELLYPEAFGYPASAGRDYKETERDRRQAEVARATGAPKFDRTSGATLRRSSPALLKE